MTYSEDYLVKLAQKDPENLVKILLNPRSNAVDLTLGIEILANEVQNEEIVLPALRRLLKHINATVREGAVIGVSSFYNLKHPPSDILDRVREIADNDPSLYLKDYAKDVLLKY